MHDIADLIFHGLHNFLIAVSGRVHSDSCIEIKIRRSIFIIDVHSFCCLRQKIETLICLDHIFIYLVPDILYC